MSSRFERIATEVVFDGKLAKVRRDRFRHENGEEVEREIVEHMGAVAVVVHDDENIWLVRQPREAVGIPDLLELPAGKLEEGESPLETAKRELAEEIGKAAEHWEELKVFWSSPGFSNERIWVYLATGLSDVDQPAVHENERIDIVEWPLADLDGLIDEAEDSKTLIGLYELRRRL